MTAPGAPIGMLGVNATLYYATLVRATWGATILAGRHSAVPPTLVPIINVRGDITISDEDTEVNMTIRNGTFELTNAGLTKLSLTIPMVYDPLAAIDAGYLALETAKITRVVIPICLLDGLVTLVGSRGLWFDATVTKIEKKEIQDGYQMVDVTIKPALTAVPPERVIVAGS